MSKRRECKLLGRVIGTCRDWDDTGDFGMVLVDFQANEFGREFLPEFEDGQDLYIDFISGEVGAYEPGWDGKGLETPAVWSVFDAEE